MATESPELLISSAAKRIEVQLGARLDRHTASGDAFVVSVYGEWGIGKTRCLRDIFSIFDRRLDATIDFLREGEVKQVVVPVFFDPWQYEHEEHLVIPLLKTIELTLQRVADRAETVPQKEARTEHFVRFVREAGGVFGDVAVSLLSGFKFKFAPLKEVIGVEVEFSAKEAIEAGRKADEMRAASKLSSKAVPWYRRFFDQLAGSTIETAADAVRDAAQERLAKCESLYFDVRSVLETLTEDKDTGPALRLVVLIDDLDRCLPEKAIQVLESVKLFLNVPGFSFVLAVDDEVVERGIAHRYGAYTPVKGNRVLGMNAPISGAEYLEKVVHLPVHLPRWTESEATEFLRSSYSTLFASAKPTEHEAKEAGLDAGFTADTGGKGTTTMRATRGDELLNLVLDAIPLVPRKLIRLAEALEFQRLHFNNLQVMELWHPRHAARVVALQQLYPGLYRHLRLRASRYWRLFSLRRDDYGEARLFKRRDDHGEAIIETGESLRDLNKRFAQRGNRQEKDTTRSETETLHENLTLLELVEQAAHQRGSPDPLSLFPVGGPETEREPRYIRDRLTYDEFAELYFNGLRPALGEAAPRRTVEFFSEREAVVTDPNALIERLLNADALGRREYLQARSLEGRLPDALFQRFLDDIRSRQDRLTDIEWLRDISELTRPEQLLKLYQDHSVLEGFLANAGGA